MTVSAFDKNYFNEKRKFFFDKLEKLIGEELVLITAKVNPARDIISEAIKTVDYLIALYLIAEKKNILHNEGYINIISELKELFANLKSLDKNYNPVLKEQTEATINLVHKIGALNKDIVFHAKL
jgi:hypothetical protein